MHTDAEWEKWGRKDPYFGVLTNEQFRRQNLTEEARTAFFESGREHVNHVLQVCRSHFDSGFHPKEVLDFGCGTGRLVIPFAEIAERVVGLDVSDSMLKEAGRNCKKYAVQNVSLLKSDDHLSRLEGRFDLIHSVIVFQHIPVVRGMRIFRHFLKHLKAGGICAVQITYSKTIFKNAKGLVSKKWLVMQMIGKATRFIRSRVFGHSSPQDPEIQMNPYNVNELFFAMQSAGVHNVHVEFTDHGGELGVFLYFQKPVRSACNAP